MEIFVHSVAVCPTSAEPRALYRPLCAYPVGIADYGGPGDTQGKEHECGLQGLHKNACRAMKEAQE